MLEIKTLGGLLIKKDGKTIPDLGLNKAQALLVYLAVESRVVSRAEVVSLLWPESSEKHGMTSLRVVLSTLRQEVGDYVTFSRTHVSLKPGADIYMDGIDLEEVIGKGDVDGVLALYRGDFLTGFDVHDSAAFEEWRLLVQERYRRLVITAFHQAISRATDQGDHDKGLLLSGKLLNLDPTDEAGHRSRMLLLAMTGRRSAALTHYEKLQAILDSELGVTPSQETEELFQRIAQDKITTVRKPPKPRHNLPVLQTSFINRIQELKQIDSMIADPHCQLLTLVGPGGIGKTRLAIEATRRNLDQFPEGVTFIQLDSLTSSEHIVPAVADALNFKIDIEASNLDPVNQLLDFLEDRSLLLVMDSFEHLISEAGLVSDILARASKVKMLVTSRERLGLKMEWILKLEGLGVPDFSREPSRQKGSAIQLFVERAYQVNHNFQTTTGEIEHVAEACRLLQGIPLGIELAAAWSPMLSCQEIRDQIHRSLDFLSTRLQDMPGKHRSMRAVFDRSWDMLTREQRKYYCELSVFQGGFTMEAAHQVVGAGMEQLLVLMDKSLLNRDVSGRFSMHNALHYFAAEKLKDGENADQVRTRHAQYYIDLLLHHEDDLNGSGLIVAREILRKEMGNLRTALDWCVIHWDQESARNALEGTLTFFIVQGWHEGKDAFQHLAQLALEERVKAGVPNILEDPVYLSARVRYALLCTLLGFHEEGEMISNESLEPCRSLCMESERSICLQNLGVITEQRGEYEKAREYLERAIELGSQHPNVVYPTYYLWLGYVHFLLGDFSEGMACFQESYNLFDRKNTLWGKGFALSKMALAADGLGEYPLAMEYGREALSIFEDIEDYIGIGYTYSRLSVGAYFIGAYGDAIEYGQTSHQMFKAINHRWGIGASLCRIGFAFIGLGELGKAAACFDEALELSWKAREIPLCLYALAGTACWMIVAGDQEPAIGLFNFIRQHPQTPALYVNAAEIWFEVRGVPSSSPGEVLVGEDGELASLEDVIDWVLKGKTQRDVI